jgi:low affinity Fe/Cu permease
MCVNGDDTVTTIVTFPMVFPIQDNENRDTEAIPVEPDELIRSTQCAPNVILDLEELDDERLEVFRKRQEDLAEAARVDLEHVIGGTGTPEP